jgi:predicted permease
VALTEEFDGAQHVVAPANLADYQRSNRIFSGLAGYEYSFKNLTGSGTPERVCGESVTAGFFSVLGVEPALGRTFLPEEDRPGGNAVVVVTHDFWQRRLGSDTDVLQRGVKLDGLRYQVIGVLPRGFQSPDQLAHPERIEFYVPAAYSSELLASHADHEVYVVGRLKPGVTLPAAQGELNAISSALQKQYPDYGRNTRAAIGALDTFLVRRVKDSLLALLGASGMIVLITCVNVANLLLMRAVRKRRETSVRFALGASRGRVVGQFLVESMLVAIAGCGAGILLGRVLMRTLLAMAPANIPRIAGVTMDWRVFVVSTAIATITGLMFGIAPAWQASRTKAGEALKSSDKNTAAMSQMRWRAVFTVVEVALSLILLIGAGLLINSFVRLTSVDLGFRTDHILSMNVSLPETRYRTGDLRLRFYQQLEERVRALPGVQSVAFASRLPLGASSSSGLSTDLQPDAKLAAGYQVVSPGYFEMLGIPLERGRLFTADDHTGQPPVAVVNQMFAQRFLSGRDPLGARLRRGPQAPWIAIVGVVKDIRRDGLAKEITPQFYLPAAQTDVYPARLNDFGARTAGDPHQLVKAIQQQVWAVDRDQTVINVRTLDEAVTASVAERRFQTLLLAIFAAVAVGLAVIGIYGVLAYSVSQRTPELGIRIALGADPREILAMVLRQAGRLIAVGVAIGVAGSYALTRFVESMLFGVRPHDAVTYLAAVALLAGVSVAASLIPARRGSKVDPMVALRYE